MDAVSAAAAPRLAEFSTQDIVLTIWAYGAVRHLPADPAFLHAAAAALLQRRRKLLPMQAAMALKGFAKCGFQPSAAFMSEVAAFVVERLPVFKPVELCHILWAYARLGYRDVHLVECVVGQAVSLLQAAGPNAPPALPKLTVDAIVWASQKVGFWPQALIDMAEMRGVYVRTGYSQQRLAVAAAGAAASGGGGGSSFSSGGSSSGGGVEAGGGSSHGLADQQQQVEEEEFDSSSSSQVYAAAGPESTALGSSDDGDNAQPPHRRRPAPVALSIHHWQQQAQLAKHRSRQQEHQQAWTPGSRVLQLLEGPEFGNDSPPPEPRQPALQPMRLSGASSW